MFNRAMSRQYTHSKPKPLLDLCLSGALIVFCVLAIALPFLWKKATPNPLSILFILMVLWLGVRAFKRASRRYFGVRSEFKAGKRLGKWLPSSWAMERGVLIGPGDLDILVKRPDGVGFAIEVKSQKLVDIQGWFVKRLVRTGGLPFERSPIEQALRNSRRVNAIPVLWFPEAAVDKVTEIDGVIVVLGPKSGILKALGLRFRFPKWLFSLLTNHRI